jgi:hypothetical protein
VTSIDLRYVNGVNYFDHQVGFRAILPHVSEYKPGSLVFCHSTDIVGRGIRWAEWTRFKRGSTYNHVATLRDWHEDGQDPAGGYWTVIQAEARGVTGHRELDSVCPGGFYTIVEQPQTVRVDDQLAFLVDQIGARYGFITIGSIVVNLILPQFISFQMPSTWICSAVAAEALRVGGWRHNWPNIYQVNPAQLFEVLTAQ